MSLNTLKSKNKKHHMKSYISVIPPRPPRILLLDGHEDPVHAVIRYGVYNFIKKAFSSKSTSTS